MTEEELEALIDGVNAAPESHDPEAWLELFADKNLSDASKKALMDKLAEKRNAAEEKPDYADRFAKMRDAMRAQKVDGFLIPRADEHQGEYVSKRGERLHWATGFTGSAGMAAILSDKAGLFVDGRYTVQAKQEVDSNLIEPHWIGTTTAADWLSSTMKNGDVLGYDPWLHTPASIKALETKLKDKGVTLKPCENVVDAAWDDQPPAPISPVTPFDMKYAGQSSADKRDEIAHALQARGAKSVILSQPDSVAWLLNIRGLDVPNTPLPLSFAIAHEDGGVDLFMDKRKAAPGLGEHLGHNVRMHDPADLLAEIGKLDGPVMIDPSGTPILFKQEMEARNIDVIETEDPCIQPRACKNKVEQDNMQEAHIKDGVAVTRFLAWIDSVGPAGKTTEMDVVERLEKFRRMDPAYKGGSFDTISGYGSNGAIVHYRVSEESSKTIKPGNLLLVDSGGQYFEGTTDITRTMAIGTPTDEMRDRFTRVLKGHINLAMAQFPDGTTSGNLDVLARMALWQDGVDYAHGTGHGVGCYLSVHEAAANIGLSSARQPKPGMVLSNEPGYYKEGGFGIRIENLVLVERADKDMEDGTKRYRFKTLTLAPIDKRLIMPELMSPQEIQWLNDYHARVYKTLEPRIPEADVKAWLKQATAPMPYPKPKMDMKPSL